MKPKRMCAMMAMWGGLLVALPASGEAHRPTMLDQLQPGLWELHDHAEGGRGQRMCLRHGEQLIQLRHQGDDCSQVLVDSTASETTVQYSCSGHGYGRTHVRRETNQLVQIDSQGIAKGQPFAFAAEGRRLGPCPN